MDDDVEQMSREVLVAEIKRLRDDIRRHRDSRKPGLTTERVRVRPSRSPCASVMHASKVQPQPRRAASIAAMSIFLI
jgi:hypothetical protein